MAARQARSTEWLEPVQSVAVAPPEVTALTQSAGWAESPARLLHERLVEAFAPEAETVDTRLSARTRLAVLVAATLLPWAVIAAGAAYFLF